MTSGRRLDSWKEIAAHFGRQVRTVQRWEREEGLPVHRHQHKSRGTIYAFADGLETWRDKRQLPPGEDAGAEPEAAAAGAPEPATAAPQRRAGPWPLWVAGAAALLLLVTALLGLRRPAAADGRLLTSGDADAGSDLALGEYLLHREQPAQLRGAIAAFQRSTRQRPRDWRAFAGLADALVRSGHLGIAAPAEVFPAARAASERARSLAPEEAEPLPAAGWVEFEWAWQFARAERDFRTALARRPGLPFALHGLAHLLSVEGRHDEAIATLRQAQAAEPLSAALNTDGCWFFYRARRFEEARVEGRRALEREPRDTSALLCVFDAHRAQGDLAAARSVVVRFAALVPAPDRNALTVAAPATSLHAFYDYILRRLGATRATAYVPAGMYVYLHCWRGDRETAIAWLARAVRERDPSILSLGVHPDADPLRGDPRFARLVRQIGA